jgi:hypothetical protein
MYICNVCDFKTHRKDAYIRHENSKKHKLLIDRFPYQASENAIHFSEKAIQKSENAIQKLENAIQKSENAIHLCENVSHNKEKCINYCKKCNKEYKKKEYLLNHEKICTGISSLTCPRCMKTFSSSGNKSKHCKKNNCKPISIFEADNVKNIINNINTTTNSNNNSNNIINSNNNITNIYINDYGKERKDYLLTYDNFYDIVKTPNNNILVKYLKCKNFNPKFPENHCIKYENKRFKLKQDEKWGLINANALKERLYYDCGSEILYVFGKHEDQIRNHIQNIERFEEVKRKANFFELQLEGSDKEIKDRMLDIVKDDII